MDLVGSTALSQSLDPEDMGDVLRSFQAAVTGGVTRFGGHVAKLLGDGVLVYFGWPTAHEDDPERAVRAGLAIVEAVGAAQALEVGQLAARVGIATGLAVVGERAGEGFSREESVVGETPNLAARLQAQAAPNTVVVAPSTRRLVSGLFELADLGSHALKGFAAPVPAWRVLGPSAAHGRFAARAAAGLTPLVGREPELALLLDRWAGARRGRGQVVLVSGEAGIGKSRLLSALHHRLRHEPLTPLLFQCSPHHLQSALWPVIDQLERSAGFGQDDSMAVRLAKLDDTARRDDAGLHISGSAVGGTAGAPHRRPALNSGPEPPTTAGADSAGGLPPPREHRGSGGRCWRCSRMRTGATRPRSSYST